MADELPLEDTTHLFIGKTIAKMDATCCNKVEFLFTDGTKVALHIDCDWQGLPSVDTCTQCVNITAEPHELRSIESDAAPARTACDALAAYRAFAGQVGGTTLGLAMSTDHPDMDGALMGLFDASQALGREWHDVH